MLIAVQAPLYVLADEAFHQLAVLGFDKPSQDIQHQLSPFKVSVGSANSTKVIMP
ncbi:MAG: hypothetical protein IMY83_00760 [Chloroflexi bacterium]|nr:hypothetical protein [Chloroflexota bacterium]